jgi:poly(3-hydroxybutyrate) depolymerase
MCGDIPFSISDAGGREGLGVSGLRAGYPVPTIHPRETAALTRLVLLACACLASPAAAEWLVIGPLDRGPRAGLGGDPVLKATLGSASPAWPKAGDKVGARAWTSAAPNEFGEIEHDALENGYAYSCVRSETDRVALALIVGGGWFSVNGERFVSDVYGWEFVKIPVALKKGDNHVLVRVGRGKFKLEWGEPPAPVYLLKEDATAPNFKGGRPAGRWGAVPVVNATTETIRDARLVYGRIRAPLPPLAPLSVLKIPFLIGDKLNLKLSVEGGGGSHAIDLEFREAEPEKEYCLTFRSDIDRSTQVYAVKDPKGTPVGPLAMVFSLHGAGVGANGQAGSYAPRPGYLHVAPTNRRPMGFDWEDWGRLDALEVLAQAKKRWEIDVSRIYLAGHSMGGHGAWQLAVQYPDQWAAVSPSAGWISFWTYHGTPPGDSPAAKLMMRAALSSDTMALGRNLAGIPVFIIHGARDDVVPVEQARTMAEFLKGFHDDFRLHEEEKATHWWDGPAPGADCLTLPEMYEFFERRRRADAPVAWEFRTASPAVSSSHRGVEVLAQDAPGEISRVSFRVRREKVEEERWISLPTLDTANVAHLRAPAGSWTVDGKAWESPAAPLELHKDSKGDWTAGRPAGLRKSPALNGPFPQAFHTPFVLVYATGGDADETRETLARARYDAQVWWYRGSGRAEILADTEVAAGEKRNLILYGNEESNAAWKKRAGRMPVSARKGSVSFGGREIAGDLALVATYPDPERPAQLVALVGASGPAGRRAWNSLVWWMSAPAIPDALAWDETALGEGTAGVRAAGWYGPDWKPLPELWHVRE